MATPERRYPNLLAPAAPGPLARAAAGRVQPKAAEGARWDPLALAQAFRRAGKTGFRASR